MAIELYQGPLDGLKLESENPVMLIKYATDRIAIYYRKNDKYLYYTTSREEMLEDVSAELLEELKTQ